MGGGDFRTREGIAAASIISAIKTINPATHSTTRRASLLATRLLAAAMGKYVTSRSNIMTMCSLVSMKYLWANGHGPFKIMALSAG